MNTRNDSPIRQYRPTIGKLVKMQRWEDYTEYGISPWSYLRVISVHEKTLSAVNAPSPLDPSQDSQHVYTIDLTQIAPPIGWEPRYTVYCKPDDVEKVLSWFPRGVVNRANHDLGSSRGCVWQPMDNASTPCWQYPDVTDAILPADCPHLLRVVKVETEEIGSFGPRADCQLCKGTGRDSIARIATVRNVPVSSIDPNSLTVNGLTSDGTFDCRCGTYMRDLGRTKRGKIIKQMESEGWTVKYSRPDDCWQRQRETIVHDWTEGEL